MRWLKMTSKKNTDATSTDGARLFLIALGVFIGLAIVIALYVAMLRYGNFEEGNWKATGVFGDSFGLLNALVASLAFIGIVVTLYMQHIQTKEMRRASVMGNVPFVTITQVNLSLTQGDFTNANAIQFLIRFNYINASDTPALDVCTSISIVLRDKRGNIVVGRDGAIPISRFVRSHVARTTDVANSSSPQFTTSATVSREMACKFLECIKNGATPILKVECMYRNFFDICCRVSDVFDIKISKGAESLLAVQQLMDEKNGLLNGVSQREVMGNEQCLKELDLRVVQSLAYVPSKKLTTKEFFRTASQFDKRIAPFESDWGQA